MHKEIHLTLKLTLVDCLNTITAKVSLMKVDQEKLKVISVFGHQWHQNGLQADHLGWTSCD